MAFRILVVDDAQEYREMISAAVNPAHEVVCAGTLAEAGEVIRKSAFDMVLLDVLLPDGSGFEFCAKLQREPGLVDLPVIFLTVRSEVSDKVMGYSLGADDYIVKPFDPFELRAKIDAKLRKAGERRARETLIQKGRLKLNAALQKAFLQNGLSPETRLKLTPYEFKLLFFMARHEDRVFSREEIIDAVWGSSAGVFDRAVDMHVSNLRKKLTESDYRIESVHGVGYRFGKI
jgi:two-component system phosphate regulon response regulator PhoB